MAYWNIGYYVKAYLNVGVLANFSLLRSVLRYSICSNGKGDLMGFLGRVHAKVNGFGRVSRGNEERMIVIK